MRIPEEKIRAWVKENFDHKERKNGEELLICNPFTDDSKYKMNINPEKGVVHCWTGDEWAGKMNPITNKRDCSFINFVKIYLNCSYQDAVKAVVGAKTSLSIKTKQSSHKEHTEEFKLPHSVLPISDNSSDTQAMIVTYWLKSRGYTIDDIKKHKLHYLGLNVYWPYYEFDELVLYQSRSTVNKIFKFPSLEESGRSKSNYFYGFDDVEFATYVIITEAIFDQYTLGQQALASGGAFITDSQLNKLKLIGPRNGVILSADNDKAGIDSVVHNSQLISPHFPVFYSLPPQIPFTNDKTKFSKDWNDLVRYCGLTKKEVRELHDKNILKISGLSRAKTAQSLLKLKERSMRV